MGKHTPYNELVPLEPFFELTGIKEVSHYTSISVLFKILRNHEYRLNRIDHVNDKVEGQRLSFKDEYERTFISCFSTRKKEFLPMWKLYTQKGLGVFLRFKFREGYSLDSLFYKEAYDMPGRPEDCRTFSVFPGGDNWYIKFNANKVSYLHSKSTRHPVEMKIEGEQYSIPNHFALDKGAEWSYEKEVRIIAVVYETLRNREDDFPDIHSLYAPINFDCIDELTIIFDPWTDKNDWESIVLAFSQRHGFNAKIKCQNSAFYNNIREL